jgi:hypothetical protein
VVSGGGEHAADLMVAAFVEGDEGFGFAKGFELGGEEGFGFAVEHEFAGSEEGFLVALERAVEGGVIGFEAAGFRVDDAVEEFSVIGHEEESGGVLVEAADGAEDGISSREARGEEVVDDGAGVVEAAGVAIGFVEHEGERSGRVEGFAAEEDVFVRGGVGIG